MQSSLRRTLVDAGIECEPRFVHFTQMSEFMFASAPDSSQVLGIVVLLRLEDWLREQLQSSAYGAASDADLRQQFRPRVEEFVSQLAILSHQGAQVWFLACPSTGCIAEQHKLAGLCRTYTNLVTARVRGLPQVTLLNWPASLTADTFEDREADCSSHIPFTQDAFNELGASVGQQVVRTLARNTATASSSKSAGSPELAAYLAGLQVRVTLASAGAAERSHIEKLLRTAASFSLTGEKPTISGAEVDSALNSEGCMLVTVSDRISDYGPSGLLVFHTASGELVVGSMALSCTVLGKQVEYAMLSALGEIAEALGCQTLVFEFRANARNQPMLTFLQQAADRESEGRYVLPASAVEARIAKAAVNPGAWTVIRRAG